MIEYLYSLLANEENAKAAQLAEQLLTNPDNSPEDLLAIYSALCNVRVNLGEFEAAVAAGELAKPLALSLQSWDRYGEVCVNLGASYLILNQYSQAVHCWTDYLHMRPCYLEAAKFETRVWFNLGTAHLREGRPSESVRAYRMAMEVAEKSGDSLQAHFCRHALIDAHMAAQQHMEVIPLLAKCASYLRRHPIPGLSNSRLHHLRLRAKFAVETKRYQRAIMIGVRGLEASAETPVFEHYFHMHLAAALWERHEHAAAYGHAIAARICGMQERRPDLEDSAVKYCYEMVRIQPMVERDSKTYYLQGQ